MTPTPPSAHAHRTPEELELELHHCVEGLQVQVRALGMAVDHLCRALDALPETAASTEASTALEDARLALGEIW